MRIVSLIPEATEILKVLGLGDALLDLVLPTHLSGSEMGFDARWLPLSTAVGRGAGGGVSLIFAAKTSEGGVPRDLVRRAIASMRPRPAVYALEPHTLGEILSDVKTVGDAVGRQREARTLIEALRARIDAVSLRSAQALACSPPPRVVCLQQSDPPLAAGWWLAELVGLAGGYDVLDGSCRPPRAVTLELIRDARPDLVVEVDRWTGAVHALAPGPSAVDVLERLAALILPQHHRRAL